MKTTSTIIMLSLLPAIAWGQTTYLSGGGDLNWGPSSLGGKELSWSRGDIIPVEEYDNYYKRFKPEKFDADEWCRLMKRWGVHYVSPTAKHHDGFALWFSDYSPYTMEIAALPVDIMAELKEACDRHGIVLGAYYSNIDWYHPDWTPYSHGGPGKFSSNSTANGTRPTPTRSVRGCTAASMK